MLCMMKCKLHNFKISYKFSHIINLAHKHFFCKYYCGYTSWDIFSKCLFPMTIQRSELIMKLITILVGAKKCLKYKMSAQFLICAERLLPK